MPESMQLQYPKLFVAGLSLAWILISTTGAKECFYCHNCNQNTPGEIIDCKNEDYCVV